ncbi:MAG TPA: YqaJ viral recombinase family protein [Fervidobacterium sp.]|nr:YqaJ viral recombinase family protein [Fervidobacterium sp.]
MNRMPTKEMTYEEWKQQRRNGIGGSDAAAAIGLNRWKSRLKLYLEKIGELEDNVDSEATYWGRILEDVVAEEFTRRTGKAVRRVNAILIHPEFEWMIANIDRKVVGENAILEVKTTAAWNNKEWEQDEIPQEYIIQAQHYMAVTGADLTYFAVLVGGQKLLIKKFVRDDELIEMIIREEQKFWQMVENRTPPELDGSVDAKEILSYMYPTAIEGSVIELPTYESTVEEILALGKQIKELEQMKEEKENKLKAEMAEHEIAYVGKYKVSWKNISQSRLDTKLLEHEQPEIYKKYLKENNFRRFSIKEG